MTSTPSVPVEIFANKSAVTNSVLPNKKAKFPTLKHEAKQKENEADLEKRNSDKLSTAIIPGLAPAAGLAQEKSK